MIAVGDTSDGWHVFDAPLDKINLHLRGGSIIPQQKPSYSLRDSRKNAFTILVPLNSKSSASGSLYLDGNHLYYL